MKGPAQPPRARSSERSAERKRMVERQIAARGIRDEAVLDAMREVPREEFVDPIHAGSAYADAPLPIGQAQTISQPFIVALMAEAAMLGPADRVLEVGTGSGYAAAVLGRIAARVFTVERHATLAAQARARFERLGYDNIEVAVRDGTLGWPDHAPYGAIIVAAGSPRDVPRALLEQLAPGGRLIIPRGETPAGQDLVRIRRSSDGARFGEEHLEVVRFVPLVGQAGWTSPDLGASASARPEGTAAAREEGVRPATPPTIPHAIAAACEPFDDIDTFDATDLLERIGDARLVLIGEASHGTSEFYRMRARITRALIEREGFDFVAVEADWPDAAELDAYVRHEREGRPHRKPFQRFPRWMWGNTDVMAFVRWLRSWNASSADKPDAMVGFHGLDLYSMHTSIDAVLRYLDDVDPDAALVARERYGCLMPWQSDPVLYGRAVLSGFEKCENGVVSMLRDLLDRRLDYTRRDGSRFTDAIQNARLVANAEKYYRTMYSGSVASWNLRDQHMFDTLRTLLGVYGPHARGIVWAHNSHLGDASATAMAARGEHNVGQLVREGYGRRSYLVGFGTHTGTVAAATDWETPMRVMHVRPSHPRSYENLAHASSVERFLLHMRAPSAETVRERLLDPRLERAIGVIYRPDTELQSHYFAASLPRQFDEWIWFDESHAVTPIGPEHAGEGGDPPDTWPFGF